MHKSEPNDEKEALNRLLGRHGSIAERRKLARGLSLDSLIVAAQYNAEAQAELEQRRHEQLLAAGRKAKVLTLLKAMTLPVMRDGLDLRIDFSVIDAELRGAPEEASATRTGHIIVGISRTLASLWGLEPEGRDKVLLEFAMRHLRSKIQDGTLSDHEELQLTTGNTASPCPFDPNRVTVEVGRPIVIPVEEKNPVQSAEPSSLAAKIIDSRDNVNAVFYNRHGERLLLLPQERALLELFRPCHTQEEFGYRVGALTTLAAAMNTATLCAQAAADPEKVKSIQALRLYVTRQYGAADASAVCDPLRHLTRLRQMYPFHTDHADGIMEAHAYFGLEYPIQDWGRAWHALLERYAASLEALLQLLKKS